MMTVSVQEAGTRFSELIHHLKPGDEVLITENNRPVAKLIGHAPAACQLRRRGSAKGKLAIYTEDEEHLQDFKEYMP